MHNIFERRLGRIAVAEDSVRCRQPVADDIDKHCLAPFSHVRGFLATTTLGKENQTLKDDALNTNQTVACDVVTGPIVSEFPIGRLLAGRSTKTWVNIDIDALGLHDETSISTHRLRLRWFNEGAEAAPGDIAPLHRSRMLPQQANGELNLNAPNRAGTYTVEIDVIDTQGSPVGNHRLSQSVCVSPESEARDAMMSDVRPLSYAWGTDRGLPAHRLYLERYLELNAQDVQGRCLEFQNPAYAQRLGGKRISELEILHIDDTNPLATIVADITMPNDIPSNHFDCIICTHVLHMIFDLEPAVRGLHRILKPGGVLLVAVPHVSGYNSSIVEFWRFTVEGLRMLLTRVFTECQVEVRGFGNSLVAAGDLRGLTIDDFSVVEIETHDPSCPAEICARAVKRGPL